MRRHVLIGRFGVLDRSQIAVDATAVVTNIDLVASQQGFGFGMGQALDHLRKLGVFPSEIGFDFLVIAALAYTADTRISRKTESQDSWTREIQLVVPVSNPDRWSAVAPLLRRLLDFLTGDKWTIAFRARPKDFAEIGFGRPRLLRPSPFTCLSLFSGGLDSLVGAINLLEKGETPLFISHCGEGATSSAQHSCFERLQRHYRERTVERLRVWMAFPKGLIPTSEPEDTTRGRSFLFFALAVFAGSEPDTPFIGYVPENGLIALNVPLDTLRLGSLSTRTTHPFYMARWNDLIAALDVEGRLENPYCYHTKGEMVAECANHDLLQRLIPESLSCASPTKGRWQRHGIEHCGYCVPCLIRRAAIEAALGSGNDPTTYTVNDLAAQPLNTLESEGQQIRSFQMAIARLQQRPDLARLFIHKQGPLEDETSHLAELADVYRRGMAEIGVLLDGVRAQPL